MKFILTLALICWSVFAAAAPALIPDPPVINARAYILIDANSGHVITERFADQRVEPASLTKMMSAYIAELEIKQGRIRLSDQVRISEKAWRMEGSRMFVEVGKTVPVEDLLRGIIIQSGNDATVALAEHIAGSEDAFASLMNEHAKRLGLKGTHFANSTGMPDPNHYTTARDLAILSQAIIRDTAEHYGWYSEKEFKYNGISQPNRNLLLWRNKSVDGIKTGHTESAGYCLVASGVQDGMRIISVVLGTKSENARADESQKLLTYGFRFFETHKLYKAGESLTKVRVWKGEREELDLGLAQDLYVTIPRGQYNNLKATMNLDPRIMAPVEKGARLGAVNVALQDVTVRQNDLVALQPVAEGGFFSSLVDEIRLLLE